MTKRTKRKFKKKKIIRIIPYTLCIIFFITTYIYRYKVSELEYERIISNAYLDTLRSTVSTLEKSIYDIKEKQKNLEEDSINPKGSNDIYNYIVKNYRQTPPTVARKISNCIIDISNEYKINSTLLTAMIETESDFNPYKISGKHARGLMQVRYDIWKDKFGLKDQFDLHKIRYGIKIGVFIFNEYLIQTNGDRKKALYLYVGKNKNYSKAVLINMGKIKLFIKDN